MAKVYDEKFYNVTDDETLGFAFIPALIGAAPGIFQTVMGLFGGGQSAQFQGLAGINNGGQQLMQALNQIKSGLASGQINPQQAVSEAQRIAGTLNDPTIFYPAKKGNDAAALQQFKQQAAAAVQEIQAMASQAAAAAAARAGIDPVTGQPTGGLGGISATTLLLVAGGLGAVYMLTNRGASYE